MKQKELVICILIGVFLTASWMLRHEYVLIKVNAQQQSLPFNIKYEMIIRVNRFNGDKCVFHGGKQVIETYPGAGLKTQEELLSANQGLIDCI